MQNYLWGFLRGKKDEETNDFTEAHMGEENNFYYNEELKRWVVRGEEDKVANEGAESVPPMPAADNNAAITPPPAPIVGKRRGNALTSEHLYTKIPGIEVIESREPVEHTPLIPFAAKSQFIPESGGEKEGDYDFIN
ncbi:hypothetical protein BBOV_I004670 [Babesia bovis T2Bo]|uniref:Uncharacterized protein n=1 Tax=Babesia bovis TaxID=5865 RepID=A7AWX0_BABBO|nr:hypothetical protein BBOV_I004670 [Babesia bovis T2Bo]EDO05548.1 hypothetical protein BBOV_I004670 [Babesia bovis T2Bo]|eukprot:XP_001609116.1 hypothetical protein [Babesia bovis T2Bo]